MTEKERYEEFCASNPEAIPFFYQPWWLNLVSQGKKWDVVLSYNKGGDIQGVWPFVVTNKWMLYKLVFHPVLTPFLGPWMIEKNLNPDRPNHFKKISSQHKIYGELLKKLPNHLQIIKIKCSTQFHSWLPFKWSGFEQTTHYTYRLDLLRDDLLRDYSTATRSEIKKSLPHIRIQLLEDIEPVIPLIQQSFSKQGTGVLFSLDLLRKIDKELKNRNLRKIYAAYNGNDELIGCIIIWINGSEVYLPLIGRGDLTRETSGTIKALIHQSILDAQEYANVYDFEGSVLKQFERVFRSFGGAIKPYHVLTKTNSLIIKLKLAIG